MAVHKRSDDGRVAGDRDRAEGQVVGRQDTLLGHGVDGDGIAGILVIDRDADPITTGWLEVDGELLAIGVPCLEAAVSQGAAAVLLVEGNAVTAGGDLRAYIAAAC